MKMMLSKPFFRKYRKNVLLIYLCVVRLEGGFISFSGMATLVILILIRSEIITEEKYSIKKFSTMTTTSIRLNRLSTAWYLGAIILILLLGFL
jgi:hypothetical protein